MGFGFCVNDTLYDVQTRLLEENLSTLCTACNLNLETKNDA